MEKPLPAADDFLIEIRNADVFLKGTQVLSGVNWTMRSNENWALVGNNGSGKTTFLRLLFGELIPAFGGAVHWFGYRGFANLWQARARIGFVSAEYQAGYDKNITGVEVVQSGLFSSIGLYEKPSPAQQQAALREMDSLGIAHLADKRFHAMSYGEARRTLLARALVNRPDALVLDEPCAGLDIPTRELFLETLEDLSRTKARLIYVTHHIEEIIPAITHVLYLKDGKVAHQGKKADMLKSETLSEILDCCVGLTKKDGRFWITGRKR
ncbi:MAG: ABC transporter ATP-binding protein [Nitrospinales bacterium]